MAALLPPTSSAIISECGRYRYRLDRRIGKPGRVVAFFGVNPSTADAEAEDATTRKLNGFCDRFGLGQYIVGNVFAYRATNVADLGTPGILPIGSENLGRYVNEIARDADVLVPCWGDRNKIPKAWRDTPDRLLAVLRGWAKPIKVFGFTKGGDPLHPLMLPYSTRLVDWN